MFKRIDHVALHINNLEISTNFYINNFGFKEHYYNVVPGGMRINYLKLGDTILELTEHSDGAIIGSHFCLEATDFTLAIENLLKNNVKMLCSPHATNARSLQEQGWQRVLFEGPDGEQIEIRG